MSSTLLLPHAHSFVKGPVVINTQNNHTDNHVLAFKTHDHRSVVARSQPVGEKRHLPGDRRRANRRSAASVRGHAHEHTLYCSQPMTRASTRQPGLAVRRPASRKIDREPAPRPRAACAAKARDSSRSQTRTNRGSQEFACVPGPHAISPTASHRLTQPEATHRRRHRHGLFHRDSRLPGVGLS